ncbi:hypothetical protein [Flavobacterium piscis]|uniref:Lipoprotein n=1 Tax=Flavobacterium piscis TaxID=1114874 RepID=A0ABU1Y954_9FLAO|nr:hypothetical protein [Flavobacterium piscis]MDR7210762.1 hypothetical protein [Flavobacterium piscis]
MKRQIQYFVFAIGLVINLFGCASFSKKKFKKQLENLKVENISKLEGNYSLNPIKSYTSSGETQVVGDSLKNNNAYQFMVNPNFGKKTELSHVLEENKYLLNLKFENANLLSIKVFQNSMIIKDTVLSGKYKKGMFYLDNKFLECSGIPYLFGGCRNNKRRIGLTKDDNLLINEAVNNEGALLFMFWAGSSYNITYEYRRKE